MSECVVLATLAGGRGNQLGPGHREAGAHDHAVATVALEEALEQEEVFFFSPM